MRCISIHVPREGDDTEELALLRHLGEFQSTPPYGGDDQYVRHYPLHPISIHASLVGGDIHILPIGVLDLISIRASREGGDHKVRDDL